MHNVANTLPQKLEQVLLEKVGNWYYQTFEQHPGEIDCQIYDHQITITLENSSTPIEKLLLKHGNQNLAQQVRLHLDQLIHEFLQIQLKEVLQIPISDCLISSNLETGKIIAIVILTTDS